MTEKMQLASLFPEVSSEAWRSQVDELLKGRDFDTLVKETSDGLRLQPLYDANKNEQSAPGEGDLRRGVSNSGGPWQILERALHPNPLIANQHLLEGLSKGATALQLILDPDVNEQSPGVRAVNRDDLATLTKGVTLDALPILLDAGPHAASYGDALLKLAKGQNCDFGELQLLIACDPAAALASDGTLPGGREEIYTKAATQAKYLMAETPLSRALAADGRVYHAAGASDAQELAAIIAAALQHLRALESIGVTPSDGAKQLLFRVAVDADIFSGATKLRALRVLWRKVCSDCRCADSADSLLIHAETATRMLHCFDPWVNQLRTTAATLAAALGGAQFVSMHGYDETGVFPSALARRCARNSQLVLQQESHLHAVVDPLGGSGFVEDYTEQLVDAAWSELQELEREGGLITALKKGKLQARIAAVKEARLAKTANRQLPLTGLSEFPNLEDIPPLGEAIDWPEALRLAASRVDTQLIDLPDGAPELADILPASTLGEQYETLRKNALAAANQPAVALVTLGSKAQYAARAAFVSNLLAAGGVHSTIGGELEKTENVVSAWQQTGSAVAILCGSDSGYEKMGLASVEALKKAGCLKIYLAGKVHSLEDQLNTAGIDGYVFMGMNAITFLQQIHTDLGVRS